MANELRRQFSKFLLYLAESLDISESSYKQAKERYLAIGKWLGREGSVVKAIKPQIYPQGSFQLGTVIKPLTDAEEYDIDLVCELSLSKDQVSQKQLKELIGQEIKGYAQANNMKSPPKNGRRCWTLNYADGAQFHMDILPAIPDGVFFSLLLESKGFKNDWSDYAIAITDKTYPNYDRIDNDWPRSNPKGYAEWFKERMKVQFEAQRIQIAKSLRANIEEVPDYKVKTPLQRAVQILKRHRDIKFDKNPDDKPVSIIITTLAAHAYNNEADLLEALINIINGIPHYIQKKNGVFWIPNPVNPLENFADKWQEHPQREENFRCWLQQVKNDLKNALQLGDIQDVGELLKPGFGEEVINKSLKHFPASENTKKSSIVIAPHRLPSRFNVAHRQKPIWPVLNQYSVTLSGKIKYDGQWYPFNSDSSPLPKKCDLLFSAKTNVPPPFSVYWQVVNTGEQAKSANQLRGKIFPSMTAGVGGLIQKEATAYTGMHWIECYIVKDGICVARSGEFVVNIE